MKWAENGVNINPELKLLQYNLGAPLQLEETDGYMPEKDGNYSRLTVYFRFERQIGTNTKFKVAALRFYKTFVRRPSLDSNVCPVIARGDAELV